MGTYRSVTKGFPCTWSLSSLIVSNKLVYRPSVYRLVQEKFRKSQKSRKIISKRKSIIVCYSSCIMGNSYSMDQFSDIVSTILKIFTACFLSIDTNISVISSSKREVHHLLNNHRDLYWPIFTRPKSQVLILCVMTNFDEGLWFALRCGISANFHKSRFIRNALPYTYGIIYWWYPFHIWSYNVRTYIIAPHGCLTNFQSYRRRTIWQAGRLEIRNLTENLNRWNIFKIKQDMRRKFVPR